MNLRLLTLDIVILFIFILCVTLVSTQCVFNATQCTCLDSSSIGLCTRYHSGDVDNAICLVDNCKANKFTCDCMGTSLCERSPCNSWRSLEVSQEMTLGALVSCRFIPSSTGEAAMCVTPFSSTVSSIEPSPSPTSSSSPASSVVPSPSGSQSPSPSNFPLLSMTPSPSPSASQSVEPSVSATSSPSPSPSGSALMSPAPSLTASPTPKVPICPGGFNTLNFVSLLGPLSTGGLATEDEEYVTNYGALESFTAKYTTVQGCTVTQVSEMDNAVEILTSVTSVTENPPADGWGSGYCKLTGPLGNQEFDSFAAVLLTSNGFVFQPVDFTIYDIDNQVLHTVANQPTSGTCGETVAVFGALDGTIVTPAVTGGTNHLVQNYALSAASMSAMGLSLGSASVPGVQMPEGQSFTCSTDLEQRPPCQMQLSFSSPIDTLVILFGYGRFTLPGACSGTIYVNRASLLC